MCVHVQISKGHILLLRFLVRVHDMIQYIVYIGWYELLTYLELTEGLA